MKLNTRWLEKILLPESDRAGRRVVTQFGAYYWSGSALKQDVVRDISATGVYIVTKERWAPGTIVSLTLQKEGLLEKSPERRITTKARVARTGEDGMGLAFVVPADQDARLWTSLVEELVEHARLDDMIGVVRMAEALLFLSRVCSGAAEEVSQLVRGRLNNHRLANAVEIAIKAEQRLASEPGADKLRADPHTVVQILESGSSTDEVWLRDFWVGLLTTSCTVGGRDNSSQGYIELLNQLTTIPLRILTLVCKAARVLSVSGPVAAKPISCRLEELITITGARELLIERDLERLSQLGLIEMESSSRGLPDSVVNITPTCLALQLFARCNGHRGTPQDFYAAGSVK
jgi:hypothetical protein